MGKKSKDFFAVGTWKVQWCGALRWSDEWNPLRMTEFRRLSDGRPRVDRHIPNLVRP